MKEVKRFATEALSMVKVEERLLVLVLCSQLLSSNVKYYGLSHFNHV